MSDNRQKTLSYIFLQSFDYAIEQHHPTAALASDSNAKEYVVTFCGLDVVDVVGAQSICQSILEGFFGTTTINHAEVANLSTEQVLEYFN